MDKIKALLSLIGAGLAPSWSTSFLPGFDELDHSSTKSELTAKPALLEKRPNEKTSRVRLLGPLTVVGVAVLYGLIELRSEADPVAYLNDSSIHAQMARWASYQLVHGHLPFDGWWPYLGLGSPQFLHYQSLSSVITGIVGLGLGQAHAFALLLYLLLATWPISVYLSARLFRLSPWVAASAALVSPLVISVMGIGYEEQTYLWIGYGLTTQLWAMWTLPLAWGATWRAIESGKRYFSAVLLVTLTVALHFMTGYLALAPLVIIPLLVPSQWRTRLKRGAVLIVASGCATAFVVVPLLALKHWASVDEFLAHTPISDSYGARTALSWLVGGKIFDYGRFPILTILAGVGALSCVLSWRKDSRARALLVLFLGSFILFFGQPTLGPLTRLIPGSEDLFLRRFVMGMQLTGIMFAGIGVVVIGQGIRGIGRYLDANHLHWSAPALPTKARYAPRTYGSPSTGPWQGRGTVILGCMCLIAALYPAWHEVATRDAANAADIAAQRAYDATEGPQLQVLLNKIKADGGGRVYAGLPQNWGASFKVGFVPVFKWLEQADIAEVGYTQRTASLMTDPEQDFDQSNPGDYTLFGIRYLIIPTKTKPPVPATPVMSDGIYALWEIPNNGYVEVVDTRGTIKDNRSDIGAATQGFLDSNLPDKRIFPTVAYGGASAAAPTLTPGKVPTTSPGHVISQRPDLVEGILSAQVHLNRKAVVVLSASYDPGWTVSVDGRPAKTEMIAPALVGVTVGPGTHTIKFVYSAYPYFPELYLLALIALAGLGLGPWIIRRARRAGSSRSSETKSPSIEPSTRVDNASAKRAQVASKPMPGQRAITNKAPGANKARKR